MGCTQYQDFCWKTCAIYMVSEDNTRMKQSFGGSLYKYLENICFKCEETWTFCESFLVKVIHCTLDQARISLILHLSTRKFASRSSIGVRAESHSMQRNARKKSCFALSGVLKTITFCPSSRGSSLLLMSHHIITPNPPKQRPDWYLFRIIEGRWQLIPSVSWFVYQVQCQDNQHSQCFYGGSGRFIGIVASLWEYGRPHITYLDQIIDKFQERLKFKVKDIEIFWKSLSERKEVRSNNDWTIGV